MKKSSLTFTAIDFETSCHNGNSICSVGLVRVKRGKIVTTIDQLVQPPDNYFHGFFPHIHGIHHWHTRTAPIFPVVWEEMRPFIENQVVVAHNGFRFDFRVLRQTLSHYGLSEPPYSPQCTLKIYGRKLNLLCDEFGIELEHHNALSDAEACAELYKLHLSGLS